MKFNAFILLCFYFIGCKNEKSGSTPVISLSPVTKDSARSKSFEDIKKEISSQRKVFAAKYPSINAVSAKEVHEELTNFWVNAVSNDLFGKWQNTPWDFNGTTRQPQQGAIACGYFVTAILQDMDLKLNRIKLSTCAASEMMKSLVPLQPIKKLNSLSYTAFNDRLKEYGKGVYVIGLDYHTGFIVNDGTETWFIHSNYIGRKGVTKEPVTSSAALQSSGTRWLVSLTGDTAFLYRWLKG